MNDEYEKLIRRLNPPRVVIDNNVCEDATVIQVDSVNRHGTLLQVVQVLTDMNLIITKAYISSDGVWFMDVFNVIDYHGNKVRDREVLNYIKKTLESDSLYMPSARASVGFMPSEDHTTIELTGHDRPGLLSEVCALLTDLHCNIVNAEIWTHSTRVAAVVHVTDSSMSCAIKDPKRLFTIKKLLCNVLRGTRYDAVETEKLILSNSSTASTGINMHRQRRLHQLMFDDRDYDRIDDEEEVEHEMGRKRLRSRADISVSDCAERDYTFIAMKSMDRPKLLFDIVCTLTDMEYVVFHGTVHGGKTEAYQEFYIRHVDGFPVSSIAERDRLIQCLQAAIERRAYEGLELELCTDDRVGLLSDITRVFRENGLNIRRAEISTRESKAKNTFYVTDVSGNPSDLPRMVDSVCQEIGQSKLQVKENLTYFSKNHPSQKQQETTMSFLFGNLFKRRTLQNRR